MNSPSAQGQDAHDTDQGNQNNNADIIIAVEHSTPNDDSVVPSTSYVFPPRNETSGDTKAGNSETNSIIGGEEIQRPFSPAFRVDHAPAFRYPGHSLRDDYTPSIRSGHLPAHQQSTRPYSPSIRNEYHPPMGGHRFAEGHHSANYRDSGKPTVIDYAGLDATVAEATLLEVGYQKNMFAESATTPESEDTKESKKGLDRAASTSSSILLEPPSGNTQFRRRSARKASFYSERAPRPPLPESMRYTFYSRSTGFVQAPSLPQVVSNATIETDDGPQSPSVFSDLLKDGCYWLDILDPSDLDMQILSKHFHVHPLTIEDISTEEVREKYEVFRHYYFVCFRTFDQDYNSGSYLQPASMYSVVFKDGIITFHFRPTNHHLNVLRRMEQLHSHITLTPDWINYALLDDITDSFASPIQTIQYEVDSIDELVLLLRESETTDMLRRIGSCRRNVMSLSRLLSYKADVVRGLMKRFDERYAVAPLVGANSQAASAGTTGAPVKTEEMTNVGGPIYSQHHRDGEILLYLGDILDHVLTMLQSLWSYEKILDRSHSNYLAQISLEINQLSNQTNQVVGRLTFFASLIVPMTFVTGLWGMNIHVPGQPGQEPGEPLDWWWGMIGFLALYCMVAIFFGKRYELI
ncbi:CorA metal ion transporter [Mortierella sp. AM989]|nr:CorA metal ion transporter [Mortierella sp. AM989]